MPDVWWDDTYVDAANVNKTTLRNSLRDYATIFSTAAAFTALDTKGQICAIIDGGVYIYDATDSTTVHDGEAICVDATGRRYKASTNGLIRVDASVNITVPTQVATISAALNLLSRYICDSDDTLTITLANGIYQPGASLDVVHPQNHAIVIRSATAPSAWTLSSNKVATRTNIKAAYAAVIDLRGSESISVYSYLKLENLAVICDNATANTATAIRTVGLHKSIRLASVAICNFNIGIVGGSGDVITLNDVFSVHNSVNGVQATAVAEFACTNVTIRYNGSNGLSLGNGARLRDTGTLTASDNGARGVLLQAGAVLDCANLVIENNATDGLYGVVGCFVRVTTSSRFGANATSSGFGINAIRGCYFVLNAVSLAGADGTSGVEFRALNTSSIHLTGTITDLDGLGRNAGSTPPFPLRTPTTADTSSTSVATTAFSY